MTENNDSKERGENFLNEYKALVDKYQYDFANFPVYVPNGEGAFKTVIQTTPIDLKSLPVKSPFIPNDK